MMAPTITRWPGSELPRVVEVVRVLTNHTGRHPPLDWSDVRRLDTQLSDELHNAHRKGELDSLSPLHQKYALAFIAEMYAWMDSLDDFFLLNDRDILGAIEAYDEIDCKPQADALREAIKVYPDGVLPSLEDRRNQHATWDKKRRKPFRKAEKLFQKTMMAKVERLAFAARHADHFFEAPIPELAEDALDCFRSSTTAGRSEPTQPEAEHLLSARAREQIEAALRSNDLNEMTTVDIALAKTVQPEELKKSLWAMLPERRVAVVTINAEGYCGNGGFEMLFEQADDWLETLIPSFETLGADKLVKAIKLAIAAYPDGVLGTLDNRYDIHREWDERGDHPFDTAYEEWLKTETAMEQRLRYVLEHPNAFFAN